MTGTSYDGTGNYDDFATIKYSQKPHYKLTLAIRGSGTGTVSSMPEGLNSDHDTTSAYFEKGSRVALTAVPTEDSTFAGWGRDCSGTGRCTVKMNDNQFVTATFTAPRYLLTVSKQGNGLGRVVSSPGGIDCGQGCAADSADYLKGTPVKLIADPKANSRFAGWSGACTGTAACVVTVNQALNVSATFTLR